MNRFGAVAVWFCLAAVPLGSCQVACPTPSEECDCEDAELGFVECIGMKSLPRNLPTNVTTLDLNSNPIGPALVAKQVKDLRNLTLTGLYLSGAELRTIEDRAFATQPHIHTLDLSNNYFTRLNGQIFYNLTHMKNLFLTNSSIRQINPIVFTFTPALEYLDLAGNMLMIMSNEISSLSNLRTLIVSHNKLSWISDGALINQLHLEHLDLSGNQLATPQARLFENLASNNGLLKLRDNVRETNRWSCCGLKAASYKKFLLDFITPSSKSLNEYNIVCSSPMKLARKTIGTITISELKSTPCDKTARSTIKPTGSTRLVAYTQKKANASTVANASEGTASSTKVAAGNIDSGASARRRNVFSNLSGADIALILIGIIFLVIIITVVVVHQVNIQSRKKSFNNFVGNLPNSMEADDDDEAYMTTKTYRHDAPVYGSTGNIVDRHKSGVHIAYDTVKRQKKKIRGSPRPSPTLMRKPPPYEPPSPPSPEGFDKAYEHAHFNNSSSADPGVPDYQSTSANNFSNSGYESDISDDLWDVKSVH